MLICVCSDASGIRAVSLTLIYYKTLRLENM